MRVWRRLRSWLLRAVWWCRPALQKDQQERDAKVEAATEYANRAIGRAERMAQEYERAARTMESRT